MLIGFGFELPAETVLPTPVGTLRSLTDNDREFANALLLDSPALTRGCILEVHAPSVQKTPTSSDAVPVTDLDDVRWHRVGLGAALAKGSGQPRCYLPYLLIHRLPNGQVNSSSSRQFVKGPAFSTDDLGSLNTWIRAASDPRLSDITVGRAMSLLSRMPPSLDALIDAVIVWESLFGAGEQELSYRISMNMACILAAEPTMRIALQKEIKRLYSIRSGVVHGTKLPPARDLTELGKRARELTLDAIRAMLTTHSTLLGGSADAFTAFVLGR